MLTQAGLLVIVKARKDVQLRLYRLRLLQYLDRLKTFVQIHRGYHGSISVMMLVVGPLTVLTVTHVVRTCRWVVLVC